MTTPPGGGGGGGTLIGAAGDIACDPADATYNAGNGTASKCRAKFTAQQLSSVSHILALGDQQYDCGGLSAFNQSYAQSWGQASLLSKTHPILADEEYDTVGTGCGAAGADGYFSYFNSVLVAQPGNTAEDPSKGYYSFDVGAWHIVALNSECSEVGGCNAGSPQYNWLQADLAASSTAMHARLLAHAPVRLEEERAAGQLQHARTSGTSCRPRAPRPCSAATRTSTSGWLRGSPRARSTRTASGSGWSGPVARATAGSPIREPGCPAARPGQRTEFGVLKLTLNATSYSWDYDVEGSSSFTDTGTTNCH